MINKKIALSGMSILASLAIMAGATFAFFTDQASSNANTFTSGTLDLHIRDNDQNFQDSVTASTVSPTNWAPGDSFVSYVCFKNNGSTDIQEILVSLNSSGSNTEFRNSIIAEKVELGAATDEDCQTVTGGSLTDFTTLFVDRFDGSDTNSTVSLAELLNDIDGTDRTEDDLLNGSDAFLPAGQRIKFRTTWRFATDAPNQAQGQTLNLDTTFTARQDEGV